MRGNRFAATMAVGLVALPAGSPAMAQEESATRIKIASAAHRENGCSESSKGFKIVIPNADKLDRIQIWGVFSVADPNKGNSYQAPQRGHLYFKLPSTKEEVARNEWADFKSVAGKREVVGFGNRHLVKLRVRKADEKPKDPDIYQVELGLVKVQPDTDYAPVKALFDYPNH